MRIFELSKKFPVEERYSLTDQIRRSSRSVCANFASHGESVGMKPPLSPSSMIALAKRLRRS
ncbi:MAG TPA: four helix bundle protein [Waterburya sp.]